MQGSCDQLSIGAKQCQALRNRVQSGVVTDAEAVAAPLAEVVGRNARRLRGTATADDLAKAARRCGLNWGTGRVSDLEHGRVSPTLPTLIALAAALRSLSGTPVALSELVEHDGYIALAGELVVKGTALKRFIGGAPIDLRAADLYWDEDDPFVRKILGMDAEPASRGRRRDLYAASEQGETEARLSKSLGVDREVVATAAEELWGRTVSAERDARAGRDASPQMRGRVTRELKSELAQRISEAARGRH